jgi:hypothetical protein
LSSGDPEVGCPDEEAARSLLKDAEKEAVAVLTARFLFLTSFFDMIAISCEAVS